jgi:hypothetical protein
MRNVGLVALCLTLLLAPSGLATEHASQRSPFAAECRHQRDFEGDRVRLLQALELARAIHKEQGLLLERTRGFQPMAQLERLPAVPAGFKLRFYGDSAGYVFSLRDDLDPCHFAIFSDESGRLYSRDAGPLKIAHGPVAPGVE